MGFHETRDRRTHGRKSPKNIAPNSILHGSIGNTTRGRNSQDPPNPTRGLFSRKHRPYGKMVRYTLVQLLRGLMWYKQYCCEVLRQMYLCHAPMSFSTKISTTRENGLRILEVFRQSFHLKPTLSLLCRYFR